MHFTLRKLLTKSKLKPAAGFLYNSTVSLEAAAIRTLNALARTDRLRLVDWDSSLKRLDHADFFTRARGILTSVYNTNLRCLHAQTPYLEPYMQNRLNLENDRKILRMRYYTDSYSKNLVKR